MATKELAGKSFLVADATGVGRPVVNLLRAAGLNPTAVTMTGGAQVTCDPVTGYWNIPKRDLVSTVQVLLQAHRLKFADALPESGVPFASSGRYHEAPDAPQGL